VRDPVLMDSGDELVAAEAVEVGVTGGRVLKLKFGVILK